MKLLYLICLVGMVLMGGSMAAFGIQQAIIDTGIVSTLWAIYSAATVWVVITGAYCYIQLINMRDDL